MDQFKKKKARDLFVKSLKIDEEIKKNEKEKYKTGKSNLSNEKIKDMKDESAILKSLAEYIERGIIEEDEINF